MESSMNGSIVIDLIDSSDIDDNLECKKNKIKKSNTSTTIPQKRNIRSIGDIFYDGSEDDNTDDDEDDNTDDSSTKIIKDNKLNKLNKNVIQKESIRMDDVHNAIEMANKLKAIKLKNENKKLKTNNNNTKNINHLHHKSPFHRMGVFKNKSNDANEPNHRISKTAFVSKYSRNNNDSNNTNEECDEDIDSELSEEEYKISTNYEIEDNNHKKSTSSFSMKTENKFVKKIEKETINRRLSSSKDNKQLYNNNKKIKEIKNENIEFRCKRQRTLKKESSFNPTNDDNYNTLLKDEQNNLEYLDKLPQHPVIHSIVWNPIYYDKVPQQYILDIKDNESLMHFNPEMDRSLTSYDETNTLLRAATVPEEILNSTVNGSHATIKMEQTENPADIEKKVKTIIQYYIPIITKCIEMRKEDIIKTSRKQLKHYLNYKNKLIYQNLNSYSIQPIRMNISKDELKNYRAIFSTVDYENNIFGKDICINKMNKNNNKNYKYDHDYKNENLDENDKVNGSSDIKLNIIQESSSDDMIDFFLYNENKNDNYIMDFKNKKINLDGKLIMRLPCLPSGNKSTTYIGLKKSLHEEDDPILRYLPYFGDDDEIECDFSYYTVKPGDNPSISSKELDLCSTEENNEQMNLYVKNNELRKINIYSDEEMEELILRILVNKLGNFSLLFNIIKNLNIISPQPQADYMDIIKTLQAKYIAQRSENEAKSIILNKYTINCTFNTIPTNTNHLINDTNNDTKMNTNFNLFVLSYLKNLLGGKFLTNNNNNNNQSTLKNRLQLGVEYMFSNYIRDYQSYGLRSNNINNINNILTCSIPKSIVSNVTTPASYNNNNNNNNITYEELIESYRDFYCRRCNVFYCENHGIEQPIPNQRSDPIQPFPVILSLYPPNYLKLKSFNNNDNKNISMNESNIENNTISNRLRLHSNIASTSTGTSNIIINNNNMTSNTNDNNIKRRSKRTLTAANTLASDQNASQDLQHNNIITNPSNKTNSSNNSNNNSNSTNNNINLKKCKQAFYYSTLKKLDILENKYFNTNCTNDCYKHIIRYNKNISSLFIHNNMYTTWINGEEILFQKLRLIFGNKPCIISFILKYKKCIDVAIKLRQFIHNNNNNNNPFDLYTIDNIKDFFDFTNDTKDGVKKDDTLHRKNTNNYKKKGGKLQFRGVGNREHLRRTINKRKKSKENIVVHEYEPCKHEGTCGTNECNCIRLSYFCDKSCPCPPDCLNRFKGCRCSPGNCRTNVCPCVIADRECDPDICITCGASDLPYIMNNNKLKYKKSNELGICENLNITRNLNKKIGISNSIIHGWGAFAMEKINKNEFIYEYTGAALSQDEADRRGKIYDKMSISFLFDLNEERVIDATRKGNKSKFINHKPKNENCGPSIKTVQGDHRIGLYAKEVIYPGQELFFNYNYTGASAPDWSQHSIRPNNNKKILNNNNNNNSNDIHIKKDFA